MSKNQKKDLSNRFSAITEVKNPLKFFALALLIVEALIAVLSARASDVLLFTLAYLATFMFVLVVMMVVLLVAKWPDVLTATRPSELGERTKMIQAKLKEYEENEKAKVKLLEEHGDLNKIISEVITIKEPIIVRQKKGDYR